MEITNYAELELTTGGGWIDAVCGVVTVGSAGYNIAVATNFWNPIGWVAGTLDAVSLACLAYWGYDKFFSDSE